jgi:hypothetical protein
MSAGYERLSARWIYVFVVHFCRRITTIPEINLIFSMASVDPGQGDGAGDRSITGKFNDQCTDPGEEHFLAIMCTRMLPPVENKGVER